MEAIEVRQGSVTFPFYEDLKSQALELAANMDNVEVNEETIKDSKKLLAAVNKRVKELEDRRIKIKRLMLEPYDLFEKQVKEIVGIVKEADETLRQQVRDLEEIERHAKREAIEDLFDKRKNLYTLGDMLSLDDFLLPKHLNKTQSIEKTEEEMIEFLEMTEKDVKVMQRLGDVQAHLKAYLDCFDLALAMTTVNEAKERQKQIEKSQAIAKNENAVTVKTFTVYDEKDFLLVEMYMKNNRIKFTVEDGM
jgi:hypothetical protein